MRMRENENEGRYENKMEGNKKGRNEKGKGKKRGKMQREEKSMRNKRQSRTSVRVRSHEVLTLIQEMNNIQISQYTH